MNPTAQTLSISVRSLVELLMRRGDIDFSSFGGGRPVESIRAHQKIQKSRPGTYTAEVPVSYHHEHDSFAIDIGGRIDGVYENSDSIVIDEIKTTARDIDAAADSDNPLHWAQAQCYAFMYGSDKGADSVTVQLTYFQLDTGDIREIRRDFSMEELKTFFFDLLGRYADWAEQAISWKKTRDTSITGLSFPFPAQRAGQQEMIEAVEQTLLNSDKLIIQAPTGIGKTMAALYPSVKALGCGGIDKIFYLSARTTGKMVAEETLGILRASGLHFKALTLTAKDKICFNPDSACTPEECSYAKGHFDRAGEALKELIGHENLDRETIVSVSEHHHVCPFELSLDAALWADAVICDYNYAFDPRVYLRRFFDEEKARYAFLVDEAHNLPDRARGMFSADMSKRAVLGLKKMLKDAAPAIAKKLDALNRSFLKLKKEHAVEKGEYAREELPSELVKVLRYYAKETENWLAAQNKEKAPFREELLDLYFSANAFVRVAERYDSSYAACYRIYGNDMTVRLFCIDPAKQLAEGIARSDSAVFFSATLTPEHYFKSLFGLGDNDRFITLPSPFPAENLLSITDNRISTLYRHRRHTREHVALAAGSLISARRGNYLVFFPSYEYMLMVHESFHEHFPDIECLCQKKGMSEQKRLDFIDCFSHDNTKTLAGFAVMGGVFSEGIDLIGDRLTAAIIVGVGMPKLSLERNLIKDYYERERGDGFPFAYVYPGIIKVLQAAGRVIRSEHDRGIICLIDRRFGEYRYKQLLPEDWRIETPSSPENITSMAREFWAAE